MDETPWLFWRFRDVTTWLQSESNKRVVIISRIVSRCGQAGLTKPKQVFTAKDATGAKEKQTKNLCSLFYDLVFTLPLRPLRPLR